MITFFMKMTNLSVNQTKTTISKLMKKHLLLASLALLCLKGAAQEIASDQWTYMEVDSTRDMIHPVDGPEWLRSFGIDAMDINRDGYKDIVCGKYFYLNPGEDMNGPWKRTDFGFACDGYRFVDVDGDHLADIIAEDLPRVIWLEADDLNGSSWNARLIGYVPKTGHKNGQGSGIADVLKGGKPEVLLAAEGGIYCAVIPGDPAAKPWDFKLIAKSHSDEGIGVGDIDGDGDPDLAFGDSQEAGEEAELLYWAENPGSIDQLWTKHLVSDEVRVVDRVEIADLNGDGKLDIAIAEERYPGLEPNSNLRVFLAGNDPGSDPWEQRIVVTQWSMNNLDAVDMDQDGDVDLVTNEHKGTEHKTEIYLNDGKAYFTPQLVGTGHEMHLGARCFDLDSDGDLEIIGVGWDSYQTLHLFRNDALQRTFTWKHLSTVRGDLEVPNAGDQQTAAAILDMDGDGISEFFITERTTAPSVVAYKYAGTDQDGKARWDRYVIEDTPQRIEAGSTSHDIDGDGDLDVVFGGEGRSNQVWWWENPYPKLDPEKPWPRHLIKDSGANKHHDQLFGDFDGDGQMELVFWNQSGGKLFLAEIPENPSQHKGEWPMQVIYTYGMDSEMVQTGQSGYPSWKGTNEQEGLFAEDIDGDGLVDIVGGGRWFKYRGPGEFQENIIDASYTFTRSLAGQFIEGGRPEVVLLAGDGHAPMYLYTWDVKGTWNRNMLIQKVIDGHSIDAVDFNGDGHLDIFCGEMNLGNNPGAKIRILLGDGQGNFIHHLVSEGLGTHESKIADLDGDGDLDILSKPYNWEAPRLDILLNVSHK
jgi:hypothetical protein